jgi:hypothetical protein
MSRAWLVTATALLVGLLAGGCGSEKPVPDPPATAAATAAKTAEAEGFHFRFFSPQSFWNTPVDDRAALDPASAELVAGLAAEVDEELAAHEGPFISTTSYSVPVYTVAADQPKVRVRLASEQPAPHLQAAFDAVPLPPDAQPSPGTDSTLVVWQPRTDRLWEFWRLRDTAAGWQASWGGAMQHVSDQKGYYGPAAWPGAKSWWGSSASSLSIAGGLITLEDLDSGLINHALAMAAPELRQGAFAFPAQRSDGESPSESALPEGAHLRLDPRLDLGKLDLPPLTLAIARAAQRYGIVVRDQAPVVKFFSQPPLPGTENPYLGSDGYFEGRYPGELLADFPWRHLQVLPMDLESGPS